MQTYTHFGRSTLCEGERITAEMIRALLAASKGAKT